MGTDNSENKSSFDKLTPQERQVKYSSSQFFKKKNEEAAAFLKKNPIPKEFIKQ